MKETGLDVIEDFLGNSLIFAAAVHRVIEQSALEESVGAELTESQLKLLKLLSLSDTHRLGDVAIFLGVSNAAASKAVDRLVGRMLLRRTEGEHDRRSIRISLTGPGRRLLAAYETSLHRKLKDTFGSFSAEELTAAMEIFNRFTTRILEGAGCTADACLQCGMYFPSHCVRQQAGSSCGYHERKCKEK